MNNAINWFELPVTDMTRARKFYETVLGTELREETFAGMHMAVFPKTEGVGGALVRNERFTPSAHGAVVYLNANGKLDACLARIEAAGGKVVAQKIDIGEPGFIAMVTDTEGNRVGLHDGVR